ncbi:hypothetical protein QBC34DRAFT_498874 [Podospora aff. communis PSN243]|uniref:Rhodopsin domain-containing protein n=1 Tax=Podospora aff. communis PSN243 TaxID=3040156 RepID=A0AAV9G696_9PEZI|nr:hypothetical protein QBC34DRAFT_498874 [Podospora aff. communis PSN243]
MSSSNSTFPGNAGPGFGPGRDTSTKGTNIIVAWSVMMTFAALTVGLRFYTRRWIIRVLGLEDWLILAAMIMAIGTCVGFIRQTFSGLGHHVWTLTPEMMVQYRMEQWYGFFFYTMSLACTKMSILVLYLRIMPCGAIRIANFVVMTIVMICNVWVFIGAFIGCIPLAKNWDPTLPGTCLPLLSLTLGNSIMHVITDFIIFALPIPILVKLNMNIKKKIGLLFVFSIGFFVCLISFIRIVAIRQLDFSDLTYAFASIAYWGAVEVNLAIICACLTTIKPLLVHLFPNILGTTHATPYSLGSSIVRPKTAGVSIECTTIVRAEKGFSRLEADVESVKSTNALSPVVSYEMENKNKARMMYTVQISAPSKAHEKLGLH